MINSSPTLILLRTATRFLLSLSLLGSLVGCLPPSDPSFSASLKRFERDPLQSARLNCFLVLEDPQAPGLRMEVAKLEVLVGDLWLPLLDTPLVVDSPELGSRQLFLGGQNVLPGSYRHLRMTVSRGEAQNSSGVYVEVASEPLQVEIDLSVPLIIEPGDSPTLLLTWDVAQSLQPGNGFLPVLTSAPPLRQMLLDLVFVSCPAIDTIFVVRADKNWVVDSFGIKGAPTFLAVDPVTSNQRLFVLATRDRMVKVVDLTTYRVVDFFPVPLNDEPTYMTTTPDGREVYLLDERNGYLSRMDVDTGRILARTQLDYRPGSALFLEEQQLLAVSLSLSQNVILLDPLNLTVTGSITTGSTPQGMFVDGNQLYIAEYGDNGVLIADLDKRRSQRRLPVGFGPRRLIASDNQIYVSNYLDGSLSVLIPGQMGVVQEIFAIGQPQEMVLDQFYRRLFVADEEAGALTVVDVNVNRIIERIILGAKPFGMAVIQ